MTGKERVRRAVRFESPDRIPWNFDANRTPDNGQLYGEDMQWVFVTQKDHMNAVDEWGVEYVTIDESFGEPKTFPLEGAESLEGYVFPDFSQNWRYEKMAEVIEKEGKEKYILGMTPCGLFQHMIDLFGFEDFMVNSIARPGLLEETCDALLKCNLDAVERMAALGADGIITMDDTALQDRPMISMEAFRRIFVPRFKILYDRCHALGMDTFLHSCGYTLDILEEMIGAGCDAVNLDQQENMGLAEISRRYKGRICFYCPMDIQRTISMTREELFRRAEEMKEAFSTEKGGFIAKTYPQPTAVEMTDEYLRNVTDAFKAISDYQR